MFCHPERVCSPRPKSLGWLNKRCSQVKNTSQHYITRVWQQNLGKYVLTMDKVGHRFSGFKPLSIIGLRQVVQMENAHEKAGKTQD
jgi:hypothetical protein